jgi:hypothetical protein
MSCTLPLDKFADNDVFGGFVDENDVGFEL